MTNPQTEARAIAERAYDMAHEPLREEPTADIAGLIATALAAKDAELARLRNVISKVCTALSNGSFCSPDCSVEFMEEVPGEVESVVSNLRARAERAESSLAEREAEMGRMAEALEFADDIIKRSEEELRMIRMKDCGAVYDTTLRSLGYGLWAQKFAATRTGGSHG